MRKFCLTWRLSRGHSGYRSEGISNGASQRKDFSSAVKVRSSTVVPSIRIRILIPHFVNYYVRRENCRRLVRTSSCYFLRLCIRVIHSTAQPCRSSPENRHGIWQDAVRTILTDDPSPFTPLVNFPFEWLHSITTDRIIIPFYNFSLCPVSVCLGDHLRPRSTYLRCRSGFAFSSVIPRIEQKPIFLTQICKFNDN